MDNNFINTLRSAGARSLHKTYLYVILTIVSQMGNLRKGNLHTLYLL